MDVIFYNNIVDGEGEAAEKSETEPPHPINSPPNKVDREISESY